MGGFPGRMAIGPGRFHQHPTLLPVLVIAPRDLVAPLECSLGTRPKYAINCGALAKRFRSPISATTVVAVNRFTPPSAIRPSVMGRSLCTSFRNLDKHWDLSFDIVATRAMFARQRRRNSLAA